MSEVPIGGLQRFGLSDYPGYVSATLFTQGCNFRCPFCHNPELTTMRASEPLMPAEQLWRFLDDRRSVLGGVVVSGGEPTIHEGVPDLFRRLRTLGFRTKLDTNGSRPQMVRRLLDARLVDYVAMDVKAPLSGHAYRKLAGIVVAVDSLKESVELIAGAGVSHEFRTTYVPALHGPDDMDSIRACLPSGAPFRVQEFRPGHVLDPGLREEDRLNGT